MPPRWKVGLPDRPGARARERRLLDELASIYRDADALYASWSCPTSTDCCRFGVTGREPYVTSIELAAIRRAAAHVPAANTTRRALPLATDERPCPFLTPAGGCAIYAARPIGCRTFWCERVEGSGAVRHDRVLALVRRIRELAAEHEPNGDAGRPLTRALGLTSARRP